MNKVNALSKIYSYNALYFIIKLKIRIFNYISMSFNLEFMNFLNF